MVINTIKDDAVLKDNYKDVLIYISFRVSEVHHKYRRSSSTLLEVLSKVGGISKIATLVFGFIIS